MIIICAVEHKRDFVENYPNQIVGRKKNGFETSLESLLDLS